MKTLVIALTLALAATTAARADEHPAKKFFVSAQKHFDLGEYGDALKDFKEAYRLKEDPVFLYNIAQCERLLDHKQEAVRAYKVYLQRAPNASNRPEVERKIATLEEAIAAQEKAQKMPPTQTIETQPPPVTPLPSTTSAPATTTSTTSSSTTLTAAAPEKKPVYKKGWFWGVVAGAVVAVGVGVGLGVGLTRNNNPQFPSVTF